jgi:hypothetical protein
MSTFFPHPTLVGLKWALLVVFFGLTVPQDGYFLLCGVVLALFSHTFSPLS